MQFKTVAIASFASFVAAQDLSLLPDCARPCFVDNFPVSGCTDQTDFVCICASDAYNNAVTSCVLGACQTADVLAALDWATNTCNAAGVPI
ncbi:CFEM domain-containing protein [Colletotrichum orchidophilum]|uniref:CFEM domain-containing protein n=1 Tax=Colletotrichum orchidophilum TaxID=1209926 RepID=A0A1G4BB19_9PEZI|nr:CFEM domain-containing protein [Colletotrichum orchidophilum]OHE98535.1 CFEM domain-containing protein [Colletotrichum orchidophilum]